MQSSNVKIYAVLDSSAWIKLIRSHATVKLIARRIEVGNVAIFSSKYLLAQVERNFGTKLGFSTQKAKKYARLIRRITVPCDLVHIIATCRDPSDDPIIALAAEVKCAYLVTEDYDLLVLGDHDGIKMVTTALFLRIL